MEGKPRLSIWERLTLLAAVGKIVAVALGTSVTAFFRGRKGASSYRKHVINAAVRAFFCSASINHVQAVFPSTSGAYEAFMKSKERQPEVVKIGDTVAGWLGDKNADNVLLWLHGGGYVMPATSFHVALLDHLVADAGKGGKSLAVLLLQYDLAPEGKFPVQLKQAAAALNYLAEEVEIKRSQIILGGDSAGGNLALAAISQLMHPRSDVQKISAGDGDLNGVILISPWVTFEQTAAAFNVNASKDVLERSSLTKWSNAFMGNAPRDNYTYPLDAAPEWWKGLPVQGTLVLAGGDELFVDDIKSLSDKLKKHNPNVELLVGEGESHDSPLGDVDAKMPGEMTTKLRSWISSRI